MRCLLVTITASLLLTSPVKSETVNVKYRGPVDLKPFACTDTPQSSFIQRVCYDKGQGYMLINLRGAYYHYCEMPPAIFDAFVSASSMGQFYNQKIKGGGSDGPLIAVHTEYRLIEASSAPSRTEGAAPGRRAQRPDDVRPYPRHAGADQTLRPDEAGSMIVFLRGDATRFSFFRNQIDPLLQLGRHK